MILYQSLIQLLILNVVFSVLVPHNTTLYMFQAQKLTQGMFTACNNRQCIFEDVIISLKFDPKILDIYQSNPAISNKGKLKFVSMETLYPKKNCLIYGIGHSMADDYDCTFESYLLKYCNNVFSFDCSVKDATLANRRKKITNNIEEDMNSTANNKSIKTTKVADMIKACDDGVQVRSNHCIASKSRSVLKLGDVHEQIFQNKKILDQIKIDSKDDSGKFIHVNKKNKQIVKFETLVDTMNHNKHDSLSILKIDLEGGEWSLFYSVINSTPYSYLPKQIIVEMHTQFVSDNLKNNPSSLIASKKKHSINKLFLMLFNLGYRVIDKVIHPDRADSAEFTLYLLSEEDAKKFKSTSYM